MDKKEKEIIQKVNKDFQNEGLEVNKIYWNGKTGKIIVTIKPENRMDGMYIYENTLNFRRAFSPTENFNIFKTVVSDKNLIYDAG